MNVQNAPILLIAATSMEMRAVLAPLTDREQAALPEYLRPRNRPAAGEKKDFTRHAGESRRVTVRDKEYLLLICGVGPVNAAFSLGLALAGGLDFRAVVNFGLAGSYDPDLAPLGAVVAATEEIWPEYGLRTAEGVNAEGLFPQADCRGQPVFSRLPLAGQNILGNQGPNCHTPWIRGPFVTVAGVSGTPEQAQALACVTGGLLENMEGFALALGCGQRSLPFAEARAVSNLAGRRPPEGWDMPGALAALSAAADTFFG